MFVRCTGRLSRSYDQGMGRSVLECVLVLWQFLAGLGADGMYWVCFGVIGPVWDKWR